MQRNARKSVSFAPYRLYSPLKAFLRLTWCKRFRNDVFKTVSIVYKNHVNFQLVVDRWSRWKTSLLISNLAFTISYTFSNPPSQREQLWLSNILASLKTNKCGNQVDRTRVDKLDTFKKVDLAIFSKINTEKVYVAATILEQWLAEKLEKLEEELTHIKCDIIGLCKTKPPEEKCITLNICHLLYQNNGETNTHLEETGIFIYMTLKIFNRYSLQIIQLYSPTITEKDEK